MKAKVKNIAIRYNGKRYEKGEELVIEQKHFNDELFVCLDSDKKEKQAVKK
ncbi:conjugal transfer protein [Ligilactobacillus sp. WILCCON 0076]|uniref:Conjugal transfer protein n=1 Tax=Ligilactobacillus ubinensis TaxID=2876789 RepID=A0A9X2JLF9_9LACO|nr:conjugal transfer protein [Ligilactobacillus ubinensis]MCP0886933.1 conjugal transfer protein [Ligilactobacillus ubinensis]